MNTDTLEKPTKVPKPADDGWGVEEEEATGFKKWGAPLIVGLISAAAIGFAVKIFSKGDTGPAKRQETNYTPIILTPAPPPPPPPPPPPEAMKEEKMIEEDKDEPTPDTAPAVSTALKASGGGGMTVASSRGGIFGGRKTISEQAKWKAYSSQIAPRISQALRDNPKTRALSGAIPVRVWLDITGRITRAKLDVSTGDAARDAAICDIIVAIPNSQPPPDGMVMPINMRITARRPN